MNKAGFLLIVAGFFCIALLLGGCCCSLPQCFQKDSRPGLTKSESDQRICRTIRLNLEMAWDDWDHLWMIDRPSRESSLRAR